MDLRHRPAWIFDLDGTLTEAIHDFETLRARLGLAPGAPILETVNGLDEVAAKSAHEALAAWERDLATKATARPGADRLLSELRERGCRLGILTRNLQTLAITTLEQAGLCHYFDSEDVLGRDSAEPKPSPDGIHALLNRWDAEPMDTVMVGDYLFDLLAGRAAGTGTILLELNEQPQWHEHADRVVQRLDQLLMD